jgi:hypothetical protein
VVISVGLVTWLIWSITPQKLYQAFTTSAWPWLVLATVVQLVVLFVWDTVALWWLFSQPLIPPFGLAAQGGERRTGKDRGLPFRVVLRARTDSILWSAINLEIGQGVFAWKLAELLGCPVTLALGRCLALVLFDAGTLYSLGIVGSFLWPMRITRILRWICVGIVAGLAVLALILKFLPRAPRQWLEQKPWAAWVRWWTWRHSLVLFVLRLVLFLLVYGYAAVGLAICHIPLDLRTIFGAIPFVLIAESLPGTGGLGERETALVYLLSASDDQRPVLLSFGLIWSLVIILGRVAIGLVSSWLPPMSPHPEPATCEPNRNVLTR